MMPEETKQIITELYPTNTNRKIAKIVGYGISTIEKFAQKNGLKKQMEAPMKRGDIFGELTIIYKTDKKHRNNYLWKCSCSCGKVKLIRGDLIKHGGVKSCGCKVRAGINHHRKTGYGKIGGTFWSKIISHAIERGKEFKITVKEAWELFEKQNGECPLTGIALVFPTNMKAKMSEYNMSLDRIDSSKGYIEGNVQWVYKPAQFMKHTLSQQEFINLCIKVANKHKRKTNG